MTIFDDWISEQATAEVLTTVDLMSRSRQLEEEEEESLTIDKVANINSAAFQRSEGENEGEREGGGDDAVMIAGVSAHVVALLHFKGYVSGSGLAREEREGLRNMRLGTCLQQKVYLFFIFLVTISPWLLAKIERIGKTRRIGLLFTLGFGLFSRALAGFSQ